MNRLNALVVALFLGVAGVVGAKAITKTMHLGAASAAAPAKADRTVVRARAKRLDNWAKALRASLAKRPPELPPVPRYAPVAIQSYVPAAVPVATPTPARPTHKATARKPMAPQVEKARSVRGITRTTRPRDEEQPKPEAAPPTGTATQATTTEPAPPAAPQPQSPPTTEPWGGGGDDKGGGGSDDPPGDD